MLKVFKNSDRGRSDLGWLQSRFSFSFADWYNPQMMGFGKLRVLNDDIIAPDNGFGFHPHSNMEIVTIVTEGVVQHQDSLGNKAQIKQGQIQIMSAGTGIVHSEINPSKDQELKLFQIWVYPKMLNITPRYGEKDYNLESLENRWEVLVSPDKNNPDTLWINQDAYFSLGNFESGEHIYNLHHPSLNLFLFVIEGKIEIRETVLDARDAIGVISDKNIDFKILEPAKLLAIEVPN